MARAIRVGRPLGEAGRLAQFMKVPELSQKAHVYEVVFPDRLTRFQRSQGSSDDHIVKISAPPDLSSWRHELRHDAESAFWLLVWWVVNAASDGCTSQIPVEVWAPLVGATIDARSLDIPSSCLDPAYAPLSELLHQFRRALEDDLHWATDTPYTHPEFLHEVFQRHILNFIFENLDKDFMKLAKADAFRKPAGCTRTPSLSTAQVRSLRGGSKRGSDPESERVGCYSFLFNLFTIAYKHFRGLRREIGITYKYNVHV
jgi:hypothetical protein